MRYIVQHIYGRYEIRDEYTDLCVCYTYASEYAELVRKAMNELHKKDMNDADRAAEIGG